MCNVIFNEFNVAYTPSQVTRRLIEQERWTRTKVEIHAHEQDEILRRQYLQVVRSPRLGGQFSSEQMIFIDETHSKLKDWLRLYGSSPQGSTSLIQSAFKSGNYSYSAVGAMSVEGTIAGKVFDENVDANAIVDFIEFDLLPLCNPFPAPRSVLILDNARPHSKARIEQLCSAQGVIVLWLPPYSYDLNPIEPAFHSTKALIKKKYGLLEPDINSPNPQRLLECLLESIHPEQACNFFRHSHVEVSIIFTLK
jgi:transposase